MLRKQPNNVNAASNMYGTNEIWKDIPSFEGVYQVSNLGRLKSFKKDKNGYVLSNINKKGDYLRVVLGNRKYNVTKLMHRLVYEVFVSEIPKTHQIDHIDGNKQNNALCNLQCLDRKSHCRKTITEKPNTILQMNYRNILRAKEVCKLSKEGNLLECYNNVLEASIKTGVCRRNIHQVASKSEYKPGKTRRQAGGYAWKYKEELVCN